MVLPVSIRWVMLRLLNCSENVRAGLSRLFLNKQLTRIINDPEHLTPKEIQYVECHGYIPEMCQQMKNEYGLPLG